MQPEWSDYSLLSPLLEIRGTLLWLAFAGSRLLLRLHTIHLPLVTAWIMLADVIGSL